MAEQTESSRDALVPFQGSGALSHSADLARRGIDLLRSQETRTVHFPDDHSLGVVYALGWGDSSLWYWPALDWHWGDRAGNRSRDKDDWRVLGLAKGAVSMPVGIDMGLRVTRDGASYLPCLRALRPTDLQLLNLWELPISDSDLAVLQHLHDLHYIDISRTGITDAGLVHLRGLMALRELSLSCTRIGGTGVPHWTQPRPDVGLSNLRNLTSLQRVNLSSTKVQDRELEYLDGLDGIMAIDVFDTAVSDSGLIKILSHGNLEELRLGYTHITDRGLGWGLRGTPKLRRLYASRTRISDAGLMHIAELSGLEQLDIRQTEVGDDGMIHLSAMTNLRKLWLWGTRVSDRGIARLRDVVNLQELWLDGLTSVTDASLAYLVDINTLREVGLSGTAVTSNGVAEFRRALPECRVNYDEDA
jgi:hypothetical protein